MAATASMAPDLARRKTRSSVSKRLAYIVNPVHAQPTATNRPANRANVAPDGSRANPAASWLTAATKTRSKYSSNHVACRSPAGSSLVRRRGGSTRNVGPCPDDREPGTPGPRVGLRCTTRLNHAGGGDSSVSVGRPPRRPIRARMRGVQASRGRERVSLIGSPQQLRYRIPQICTLVLPKNGVGASKSK